MTIQESNSAAPLIEARSLRKRYEQSEDAVLQDASIRLAPGECVALLGASGSGKSTFLHCLGLLDRPESGQVLFEGRELSGLNDSARAEFRLRHLGFIFQFHHLIPELTALENVSLPSSLLGKKDDAWAGELLTRVGLGGKEKRFPWQLSGGEQQRVALARSLVNRPRLLLTDEATGNLDSHRAHEILSLLLDLSRDLGTSILSVTHDEDLARRYQKQYRLKEGRIWDSLSGQVGVNT